MQLLSNYSQCILLKLVRAPSPKCSLAGLSTCKWWWRMPLAVCILLLGARPGMEKWIWAMPAGLCSSEPCAGCNEFWSIAREGGSLKEALQHSAGALMHSAQGTQSYSSASKKPAAEFGLVQGGWLPNTVVGIAPMGATLEFTPGPAGLAYPGSYSATAPVNRVVWSTPETVLKNPFNRGQAGTAGHLQSGRKPRK